jgi:pseudoazurin|tara:strand:+ start:3861 stop:4289 length:429 start_codon:yes stop_codon:yes gene_type:complete
MKALLLTIIFLSSLFSGSVFAKTVEVEMLNRSGKNIMVFSKRVVNINSGDNIFWKSTDKGHNVEFVTVPDGVKGFKSKIGKNANYTFTKPGVYLYQCTPHKMMGMIGIVIVDDDYKNLDLVKKTKMIGKSKKILKQLTKELK